MSQPARRPSRREGRRGIVADIVLLAGAATVAAWPLFGAELIDTHDGLLHVFRFLELDRLVAAGVALPRWGPDLFFGYGYPVFNYYPTLAYYLLEGLHRLGLGVVAAVGAAYWLGFVLAGGFAYALAGDVVAATGRWRRPAMLTAGIAYIFTPHLFHEVFVRGALAGFLALALLPGLLWAFGRLAMRPSAAATAAAAGILGVSLLVHNVVPFVAAPLVGGFWLWRLVGEGRRLAAALGAVAVALGLGLALGAHYWLPVLAESRFVQLGRAAEAIDFHQLFYSPATLVELSLVALQRHDEPAQVGLVQLAVFVIAGAIVISRRRVARSLWFFMVAFVVSVFMMLPVSVAVWDAVPGVGYVQFPERFLVFVALATAMWTGAAVAALPGKGVAWAAFAVVGIVLAASTVLGARPTRIVWPDASLSLAKLNRLEYDAVAAGATAAGQFLPIWVEENSYTVPRPAQRLTEPGPESGSSPPRVEIADRHPLDITLRTSGDAIGPVVFHSFYFPGWHAYLDGQPVAVEPHGPLGLAMVEVPAGEHGLQLRLEPTLPQRLGDALTVAGALGVVVLAAMSVGRWLWLGVPLLAGAVLWLATATPVAAGGMVSVDVVFGDVARLVAVYVGEPEATGVLPVELYWQALRRPASDYVVGVRLRDGDGQTWTAHYGRPNRGMTPTILWERGELVPDVHRLVLPPGGPTGPLALEVTLTEASASSRQIGAVVVPLSEVGRRPAAAADEWFDLGGRVALVGHRLPPRAAAGDEIEVGLRWQALARMDERYTVFVHVVDGAGRIVAQSDSYPRGGRYPTDAWDVGESIEDVHRLRLPAVATGTYRVYAGMYYLPTLRRLAVAGDGATADAVYLGELSIGR